MAHRFFALLLAQIVALALGIVCPLSALAVCELASYEIPVKMEGLRAVAKVKINGTESPLILDSGAFFSMLSEATALELQLPISPVPPRLHVRGLTGEVDVQMTHVDRLGLQNDEHLGADFLVVGNKPDSRAVGLLGRNLLGATDTEYDLPHHVVRLMKPSPDCAKASLAYWAGSSPVSEVPLKSRYGDTFPPIEAIALINGEPVRVTFDTGAYSVLSLDAAKRVGLAGEGKPMTPAGKIHGLGRGEAASWTVPIRRFELGQERIDNGQLRVADFDDRDAEMLLGIDFFLSHRIYVARSQKRIYITYSGGSVFSLPTKADASAPEAQDEEAQPQDAAAFARRGWASVARGDLAAALRDLDRACELAPTVGSYFRLRSDVHWRMHQRPAAMADLDEALRLDPSDHKARLYRAQLRWRMDQSDGARADLEVLDHDLAPQARLRLDMAPLYSALGDRPRAIAQLDLWIAAHADDAELHRALNGRCWYLAVQGKELDKALADCDAAVAARPQEAAYLDSRALVHLRRSEFASALSDYDAALNFNPKLAWSLYGRGIARVRTGKREDGLADIAMAKQLQPGIDAEAATYGIEVEAP